MPADLDWDPAVWAAINAAVRAEVGRVRVAQKAFSSALLPDNPMEVSDDVIRFPDFSIEEDRTKPFVEISQVFSLTPAQFAKEPMLKTAQTLARMAAKAIALAEDNLFSRQGCRSGNSDRCREGLTRYGAVGRGEPE